MNVNINKSRLAINKLNKIKTPILCLTAYTAPIARIVDKYANIILVGDSLGPVLYGYKSTRDVTIEMMIKHASAVVKNSKRSLVVVDMPFGTYEKSKNQAFKNAQKILSESGASAVKLEGGESIFETVRYLTKKKIKVMGHIGMLPQSLDGVYKVYGRKKKEKDQLMRDLRFLEEAGVFSIVIECTLESLVNKILHKATVPIIGIGASSKCDGQIIVTEDLLGLTDFSSKFLKKYANIKQIIDQSIQKFFLDVNQKKYPKKKHCYK